MLSKTNEAALESRDSILISEPSLASQKFGRPISIIAVVLGASVLIWTAVEVARQADARVTAQMCLPFAIGIALVTFGAFVNTRWNYVVGWGGLALIGQAASLQMIDAGRFIHFQNYRPVSQLFESQGLALSVFALQVFCVVIGLVPRINAIKGWLGRLGWWRVGLVVVVLSFSAAAVTPDAEKYLTSLGLGALIQLVAIANIVLMAWAVPDSALDRFRGWSEKLLGAADDVSKPGVDRFSLIAAAVVVVVTGALSFFVYEAHPHVPDESQYLFQAKYMAAGQLTVKAPLVPEAFSMYMVPHEEPRWFGIFPPAWPAMLAAGSLVGAIWLVNPLLAGLCILLTYLFFQELYDRRSARIAVLLLCCSPWFIFMGMSFMSHMATLALSLAAIVLLMLGRRSKITVYAVLAGMALGIISLIRPLDAAIVGTLLAIWLFWNHNTWKALSINAVLLGIGTAATAALVFPYNKAITGNAWLLPFDAYYNKYFWPGVTSLGFGSERGMHWGLDALPGHSPIEALINGALNTFSLNIELFGWGAGSLLLILLVAVGGGVLKKDAWAIVVVAFVIGVYSLFWYHGGPDFGARYWFLVIIPLIALTIRGGEWLWRSISAYGNRSVNVSLTFAVMCLVSIVAYLPWRAADKYYGYLGMRPGIKQLAHDSGFGRSLVIVRGTEINDYQSAWVYNPVNFEGDEPIYASDRGPEIYKRLLQEYADRTVWVVNGPSLTGAGYSVVLGPVNVRDLLSEQN